MKRKNKAHYVSQAQWVTFLSAVGSRNIILFDFIKNIMLCAIFLKLIGETANPNITVLGGCRGGRYKQI